MKIFLLLSLLRAIGLAAVPESACFGPLVADRKKFIDLPEGFTYQVLLESGKKMTDGKPYPQRPDMTIYKSTGKGRAYLIVGHEIAADINPEWGTGALTQHHFINGRLERSKLIADGMRNNCGGSMTPWGTVLTNEEFPRDQKDFPDEGYIWEVDPRTGHRQRRDPLGRFSHETAIVAKDGSVYMTEDHEDGMLWRFIPKEPGDLGAGTLYAYNRMRRFWAPISHPTDAHRAGIMADGTPFNRFEGMVMSADGRFLYIAETGSENESRQDPFGRIYRMTLANWRVEAVWEGGAGVLANPDNLALDGAGNLWIFEDRFEVNLKDHGANQIWVLGAKKQRCLFARMARMGCEPTGPAFSASGRELFFNTQCPSGKDATVLISGDFSAFSE